MSGTLIATIAGIITAIGYGAGDWFTGKGSKAFDGLGMNFAVQVAGTVTAVPVLFFMHNNLPDTAQLSIIFLISALITVAYLAFIKALSTGSVGIVVPLGNIYPFLTLVLSIIFLGSVFSGGKILAMICIVVGALVLAYEKNDQKIPLTVLHKETFFALSAAGFWGLDFFLLDTLIKHVGWQVLFVLVNVFLLVLASLLLLITKRTAAPATMRKSLANRPALYAGLCFTAGSIAFYTGSHRVGSVIIPTVIAAGGPLIAALLGAIFDHERIGWPKRLGATIVVTGIVILNLV
jgi:drug/metabolite transporter (DMT)-like permease